jgi:hypothetical protein
MYPSGALPASLALIAYAICTDPPPCVARSVCRLIMASMWTLMYQGTILQPQFAYQVDGGDGVAVALPQVAQEIVERQPRKAALIGACHDYGQSGESQPSVAPCDQLPHMLMRSEQSLYWTRLTVDDGDLLQLEGVVICQVLLHRRQDVVGLAARQQPQPRCRTNLDRRLFLQGTTDARSIN